MNYIRFTKLLRTRYPESELNQASRHGGYSNARTKNAVTIVFRSGGKCYDYTGSYTEILEQLGIRRTWRFYRDGKEEDRFYTEDEARKRVEDEAKKQADFLNLCQEKQWYVYPQAIFTYQEKI